MATRAKAKKRAQAPYPGPVGQSIRQQRLRKLVQESGGQSALARRLDMKSHTYLAGLLMNPPARTIGEKAVRSWEAKLGLPTGWFDGGPQAPADDDLLESVVLAVLTVAPGTATPAVKIAKLVVLTYQDAVKTGALDMARLEGLMKLAN